MVFSNWVSLIPGQLRRLHFTDYYYVQREIYDKELGRPKKVWSHVFYCDEVDGEAASKTFSVLSEKLWSILEPYSKDNEYRGYDFVITQAGEGFYKDFNVQVIKRA